VLHHRPSASDAKADASLKLTHALFLRILTGKAGLMELLLSDELELEGSEIDLLKFFSLFDKPEGNFDIVSP
jgi:alkyl sulfatase BDS1-like metallo-beta-lactamase superfamily hydrolase